MNRVYEFGEAKPDRFSKTNMINNKICISIGEVDFLKCLRLAATSPLIEVRLDLMKLDPEKIDILAMQSHEWVATCRPGNYTERERTVQLSASIRAGATYTDLEYEASKEYRQPIIDLAKRLHTKVIISYHNYDSTPDISILDSIIKESVEMGADIVKLAVMAQSAVDCARVMSLYEHHNDIIAFAMGDTGKITRIAAPFLGAAFTYASIDETYLTAPGQLTASQLEVIYQML